MPDSQDEEQISNLDADELTEKITGRRARQMGEDKSKNPPSTVLMLIGTLVVIVIVVFLVGPRKLAVELGLMEEASTMTPNISEIDTTVRSQIDGSGIDLSLKFPSRSVSEEEKNAGPSSTKIAELENELKKLKSAGQLSLEDLEQMVESKALELFEQQRQMFEAEEQRRLNDQLTQEEAAELAQSQIVSPGLVFDDLTDGQPSPGSANVKTRSTSQNQNEQFVEDAGVTEFETSKATSLGDLSRIIVQGTIMSAVMETAIDTELPGNVRAQITEPVYSYDGRNILLPGGTRLIGTFSTNVSVAQRRVLIAWNRAITPNGKSIALGSIGADQLGRSGTLGNVDNRYGARYGSTLLISVISAVPKILSGSVGGGRATSEEKSGSTLFQFGGDSSSAMNGMIQSDVSQRLSLPPLIRIPQGEEIRIFANRDLVF
ncbi:TrbI/VirB10 family protein [uncultured Roseibium sp.]|uniref:TrbI/VirB10 family protein n=1 Tax=uncultured Roseibium sp. TaxID=1936171 RepID=UPI00260F91B4|nr:TrbI/VirB10 family protein [uncultured Roseibium sp.]